MVEEDTRPALINFLCKRDSMDKFSKEEMGYLMFLVEQDIQYFPERRII